MNEQVNEIMTQPSLLTGYSVPSRCPQTSLRNARVSIGKSKLGFRRKDQGISKLFLKQLQWV